MPKNATRRPATIADLVIGAIVYKGNGKVAYRIVGTRHSEWYGETIAEIVKATTVRVPAKHIPYAPAVELTIEN